MRFFSSSGRLSRKITASPQYDFVITIIRIRNQFDSARTNVLNWTTIVICCIFDPIEAPLFFIFQKSARIWCRYPYDSWQCCYRLIISYLRFRHTTFWFRLIGGRIVSTETKKLLCRVIKEEAGQYIRPALTNYSIVWLTQIRFLLLCLIFLFCRMKVKKYSYHCRFPKRKGYIP